MTAVGLVWAEARDGAIGRGGEIPWHVPEDLAHFKAVTLGAPVVMGRRTWESLPERFRPLPGRENIVVTRDPEYRAPGARVVTSLADAYADPHTRYWVIGGGELYREAMTQADELIVTRIAVEVPDADTHAPKIGAEFVLRESEGPLVSRTGLEYRFERWERATADAVA